MGRRVGVVGWVGGEVVVVGSVVIGSGECVIRVGFVVGRLSCWVAGRVS